MRHLIIGMGEIGTAVSQVMDGKVNTYDKQDGEPKKRRVDMLHICFPYYDGFIHDVQSYIELHKPKYVVVWSTVPVGTCKFIGENVAHSPVEGKHPHLTLSIKLGVKWLSCNDKETGMAIANYFESLSLNVRLVYNTDYTEFLKLRSTSKYGINLVWTDYERSVADQIGMDFSLIKEFDIDYNHLYNELGLDQYQRYILEAPGGKIGGHCVVPNAELLDSQFPNQMLKMIKRMK